MLLGKEFEPKQSPKRDFEGAIVDRKPPQTTATSSQSSSLLDAARAAGLDIKPGLNSGSDPMSSISALLAAAQATGGHMPMPASSGPRSAEASVPKPTSSTVSSASKAGPSASQQGLDLSNPQGAMAANVNVSIIFRNFKRKPLNLICSRLKCSCITICRSCKLQAWETRKKERSVRFVEKLYMIDPPGIGT